MGTQPQDPYGAPQYGQPQYGQPSCGWPHQGAVPYGAGQPVDPRQWAAAHAGPPPPAVPERPRTVTAALAVYAGYLVVSLASSLYSWTHTDQVIADSQATFGGTGSLDPAGQEAVQRMTDSFATIGVVVGIVLLVGYAVAGWAAWTGRNWGRIVLWVVGGFAIVGLVSLFLVPSGFLALTAGLGAVLAVAWTVLMALRPSNAWYRSERYRRQLARVR